MRYKWRAADFEVRANLAWRTVSGWKYGRFGVNAHNGGSESYPVMGTVLTHLPTGRKITDGTDAALSFELAEMLEHQLGDEVLDSEDVKMIGREIARIAPWFKDGEPCPWVDEDGGLGL